MNQGLDITTAEPASRTTLWLPASILQWMALGLCAGAETYFLKFFQEARWQPTVDLAWLIAVVSLLAAFWRSDTPLVPRLRHPYWLYALYAAALLPFGTNWRWTMAGDNLSWPFMGMQIAAHGPGRSVLSVNGADDFGYLQMMLHDAFMFLVAPTLFWHRVGKITVGVAAMAAIYAAFARLVTPLFGILVAACAASTSVWIVYTYASVPFMDGIASGYALLAVALWVRRSPESRKAWLTLGLLSGFMLFLTPNGWFMAFCVWLWLTPQVFWRRWPVSNFALAVVLGLVTGLPNLIQWSQGTGGQLFSMVENPAWTAQKVLRFLYEAATIPFLSDVQNSGAFGPQLPFGFRWLFVPGILITTLLGSRRFPAARFVFCIFVGHVVVLAFAQGPYASVSVKRSLILIPMAICFVFLPYHRYLRSPYLVAALIAAWASFGVYDIMARFQPGRTGYNFFDGVVEAHQRFNTAPVCVVITDQRGEFIAPGSDLERLYRLSPHVKGVRDPADASCSEFLCYCPQVVSIDLKARGYVEIPMLGTVELRCGRRYPS